MELVNSNIAERLKAWRKHLGMTQEEFSARTGLHIGVVRKYENNINVPGGDALAAIGKTGVNLNWLVMGEGPMTYTAPTDEHLLQHLWEISRIMSGLNQEARHLLIEEIFSRVREAQRLADLEEIVRSLRKKAG